MAGGGWWESSARSPGTVPCRTASQGRRTRPGPPGPAPITAAGPTRPPAPGRRPARPNGPVPAPGLPFRAPGVRSTSSVPSPRPPGDPPVMSRATQLLSARFLDDPSPGPQLAGDPARSGRRGEARASTRPDRSARRRCGSPLAPRPIRCRSGDDVATVEPTRPTPDWRSVSRMRGEPCRPWSRPQPTIPAADPDVDASRGSIRMKRGAIRRRWPRRAASRRSHRVPSHQRIPGGEDDPEARTRSPTTSAGRERPGPRLCPGWYHPQRPGRSEYPEQASEPEPDRFVDALDDPRLHRVATPARTASPCSSRWPTPARRTTASWPPRSTAPQASCPAGSST